MKIEYSPDALTYLRELKSYISKNNPQNALNHLQNLKKTLETFLAVPKIGKKNAIFDREDIRESVVLGYKVIYQVFENKVVVLVIYKNINFHDENIKPLS